MAKSTLLPGMSVKRLSDVSGQDYVRMDFPRTGERPPGNITEPLSILTQPTALRSALLRQGYKLDVSTSGSELAQELQRMLPDEARPLFTQTGWVTRDGVAAFAFPDELIGDLDADLIVADSVAMHSVARGGTSGKLRSWRKLVAMKALKSQAASLAVMASFASALLRYAGLPEFFVLNIAGNSSSGKSTAIAAAISVWGNPDNCQSWDASDEGIMNVAVSSSGLGLFLDDAEKAHTEPRARLKRVHALIHKVVSGKTRQYSAFAERTQGLSKRSYECISFCTSPVPILRSAASDGAALQDSDRVRFLEITVPEGDDGGIFAVAAVGPLASDSASLVGELKTAASKFYGRAGRKWARLLVSKQQHLSGLIRGLTDEFVGKLGGDLSALEGRIAKKVALIYAAGVLAAKARILPWDVDTVSRIAVQGFQDICAVNLPNAYDIDIAILQLRDLALDRTRVRKTRKKLSSLRRGERDGYISDGKLYLSLKAYERQLENDLSNPVSKSDIRRVLKRLNGSGALLEGHGGGPTQDVRVAKSKRKFLVFNGKALTAEIRHAETAVMNA